MNVSIVTKMQDVVSMMFVLIVQALILMILTLKIAFQKNLCFIHKKTYALKMNASIYNVLTI